MIAPIKYERVFLNAYSAHQINEYFIEVIKNGQTIIFYEEKERPYETGNYFDVVLVLAKYQEKII